MTTEYISVAEAKRRAESLRNHAHMERVADETTRFYEQMSQADKELFMSFRPQIKMTVSATLNWDEPTTQPATLHWD